MLQLRSDAALAHIDPVNGAGIVDLSLADQPILSTGHGRPQGSPFAQGMNLLVPFSNRISMPFTFAGKIYSVPANLLGEPFAIHGDAFQEPWDVQVQAGDHATLTMRGDIGPFLYDARVAYVLGPSELSVRLDLTNRAEVTLPYGGGFHPWFPRYPTTKLAFRAGGYWPENKLHLPVTRTPVQVPGDWQFDHPSSLPYGWINAGFSNWDGVAHIYQPTIELTIKGSGLSTALLYSPDADAPFFCFEPVSHPVDAHNLPGQPGLVPLAPGQSFTLTMQLSWQAARARTEKEPQL